MRIKIDVNITTRSIAYDTKRWVKKRLPYHKFPSSFRCSCGTVSSGGAPNCPQCGALNVVLLDHEYMTFGGWLTMEELFNIHTENLVIKLKRWDGVIKRAREEDRRRGFRFRLGVMKRRSIKG